MKRKRIYTYVTLVNGNVFENVWASSIRGAKRAATNAVRSEFRRIGKRFRRDKDQIEVVTWRTYFNQP